MSVFTRGLGGLVLRPPPSGRAGDPGLFGPGSEVWRVGRERVLLAGGATALLLQLAHPLIGTAVAEHSRFRSDPFERLRATLEAVLAISFGDTAQAGEAAARVAARHRTVRGALEEPAGPFQAGTAYDAGDPELAMWVHATLVHSAFQAYSLLVGPLEAEARRRYYREAGRFARLFGVTDDVLPPDEPDFQAYLLAKLDGPELHVGPVQLQLGRAVLDPPLSRLMWPALAANRLLTAGMLPPRLRQQFELPWGRWQVNLFRAVVRSTRLSVRTAPPAVRYWSHYRCALRRVSRA